MKINFSRPGLLRVLFLNFYISYVTIVALLPQALDAAHNNEKLLKAQNDIAEFIMCLETSEVKNKSRKAVEKISKKSDNRQLKLQATALLAIYKAEIEKKPDDALKDIASYLLENSSNSDLKKKNPSLPPPSEWNFKYPEVCLSAARILISQKKYSDALYIINKTGSSFKGIYQVLAYSSAGSLFIETLQYQDAVTALSSALKILSDLDPDRYSGISADLKKLYIKIITQKLHYAEQLRDSNLYGPEFLAYKKARKEHLKKNYIKAYLLYSQIINRTYPDDRQPKENHKPDNKKVPPVYLAAAALYRAQCLIALGNSFDKKQNKAFLEKLSSELKKQVKNIKRIRKNFTIQTARMYDSMTEENKAVLQEIKNFPPPAKITQTALEQLENFINEDKFGVYRGEAYLTLADYYLEQELNREKCKACLIAAAEWLNHSEELKKAASEYEVPEKAKFATEPDSRIYETDSFQNINPAKIKPEMIINRLTSNSYMDSLKTKYYRMRGFLFFADKNYSKALEYFRLMRKHDKLNAVFEANGDWGDCSRLIWGANHHFLYATEKELDSFGKKFRFPILLADYYYVITKFEKSVNIHRKILAGKIKGAPRIVKAYSTFMIGHYFYWTNQHDKTVALWKQSYAMAENSYTGERSLYAAAKIAVSKIDNISPAEAKKLETDGLKTLRELSDSAKFRDFKIGAKTSLALYLYKKNRKSEALQIINSITPQNDFESDLKLTYIDIINEKYK